MQTATTPQEWTMATSQPIAALKRPPLRNGGSSSSSSALRSQEATSHPYNSRSAASSSSSLSGLEQYSPGNNTTSFQDFIKQTRSINPHKPLPPTPLASQSSPRSSEDGSRSSQRRSSSVYSRTQSQWLPNAHHFQAPNFDADPLPLLKSRTYDESPYGLPDMPRPNNSDLLEPRSFAPLLTSPSPSICDPRSRPTTLTMSSVLSTQALRPSSTSATTAIQKPKVRLMSISKANRDAKALGAVHLLPEELRAQSAKKTARMSRQDSLDMFGLGSPPPLPTLPVSVTNGNAFAQNSWRILGSTSFQSELEAHKVSDGTYDLFKNSFHVGKGPSREMLPLPSVSGGHAVKASFAIRPRRSDEEPRGRPRERSQVTRNYAPSPPKLFIHDTYPYEKAGKAPSEASDDNSAYKLFLTQYDRRPSAPRSFTTGSSITNDDEIRQHMKMVPQPLFQGKAPAQSRKESSAGRSLLSQWTGYTGHSQESFSSGRASGFPLRVSMDSSRSEDTGRESKGSTTGMIPISPPVGEGRRTEEMMSFDDPGKGRRKSKTIPRASALYPHIMSRAGPKKNQREEKKKLISEPMPLLSTFDQSSTMSVSKQSTPRSIKGNTFVDGHRRNISDVSARSDASKRTIYQRAMQGVTKHVRKTSKLSDSSTASTASPIAAPNSPHLLPSPVKSLPSPGWAGTAKETAKATWESAKSRTHRSRPSVSHITAPARPLDERAESSTYEVEGTSSKIINLPLMNGLGAKFLGNYREGKAAKRREGLKRMITVVGVGDGYLAGPASEEDSSDVGTDEEQDECDRRSGNWM